MIVYDTAIDSNCTGKKGNHCYIPWANETPRLALLTEGAVTKDQQRLCLRVASIPKFSGQGNASWKTWLFHFEQRVSEVEKGQRSGILIDLLEGIALDKCAKLTSKELQNYEMLKSTL